MALGLNHAAGTKLLDKPCSHKPHCCGILAAAGYSYLAITQYLQLLQYITALTAWEQHISQLLAQPALRSAVLDCLLRQVLQVLAARMEAATAAGISWEGVQPASTAEVTAVGFVARGAPCRGGPPGSGEAWLGGLMRSDRTLPFGLLHLAAAAVNLLCTREVLPLQPAAALMLTAERLAAALPAQRPAAMPPRAFAILHTSMASLLNLAAEALSANGQQQAPAQIAAFVSSQLGPAAWSTIRLVPYMARTLRAVAADQPEAQAELGALLCMYHRALQLLSDGRSERIWQVASWEQLSAWAVAADAGLRLLATLVEIGESSGLQSHVEDLFMVIPTLLGLRGAQSAEERCKPGSLPPPGSHLEPASQLWQLHSSVARLIHCGVSRRRHLPVPEQHRAVAWPALQYELLYRTFLLAMRMLSVGGQQPR